jgi:hypothetical protein
MSDAILAKVRKLLAKAENPGCTPAEAAAFTAKATELIAKYGVDSALLAAADPALDPVGDLRVHLPAPYAAEKAGLLAGIALALRCRPVRIRVAGGYDGHLFGHDADLRRCELLYTSLLVQAAHGLAAAPVPGGHHPAAFRRTWLIGFRQAVVERLRAAESRAVAESGAASMALVLADRGAEVEQRLQREYPELGTLRPRRLTGWGMGSGYAAGQRANLAGTGLGHAGGGPAGITGSGA